jgi:hypothetical protein
LFELDFKPREFRLKEDMGMVGTPLFLFPSILSRFCSYFFFLQGTPVVYTGMMDVFKKTVEKEGVRGLYRGIIPNYLKVIPAVSISYTVYEAMKKTLGL